MNPNIRKLDTNYVMGLFFGNEHIYITDQHKKAL